MTASTRQPSVALALAIALLLGWNASAATVDVFGSPGAPGTPPSVGLPAVDGGPGGDGGSALAIADSADSSNSASATAGGGGNGGGVTTFVQGTRSGGAGGAGGDASAGATAASQDSATATATSLGGSGGAGGQPTTGSSTLPAGAPANGGDGGDASASSSAISQSGSAIATASASGGDGGAASIATDTGTIPYTYHSADGGDGGDAIVSASASGSGAVSVEASANGGDGGRGVIPGAAGAVSVGTVSGISDGGGAVTVSLSVVGGTGGSSGAGGQHAPGASVHLSDAVFGDTSGALRLVQQATAGHAGGAQVFPGTASADSAAGGDASSTLQHSASATSLEVLLSATGGAGSLRSAGDGRGGSAAAGGNVSNDAGSVLIGAFARGGGGGGVGAGGDATANTYASTTGDGHSVSVGAPSGVANGARGGNGDLLANRMFAQGDYARGGDATSISVGEAFGESDVYVRDDAIGGHGGTADGAASGTGHNGSRGGNASSSARAIAHGGASATAESTAIGGNGGDGGNPGDGGGTNSGGASGAAQAHAYASSDYGAVTARAFQRSGETGWGPGGPLSALDSVQDNAADGDTLGSLTLQQWAYGGSSYDAGHGGGDALSRLSQDRAVGGDLSLSAIAVGGYGTLAGAGLVEVFGVDHSGAQVTIDALASGGEGLVAGSASVRADGRSDAGGRVSVSGEARGGVGASGSETLLHNAVTGETSGELVLEQNAYGGSGRNLGGRAGSELTHIGSSSSIAATVRAVAGDISGSCCGPTPPEPLTLPTAAASARIRNQAGSVDLRVEAEGGDGGSFQIYEGFAAGSDAEANADGESEGDGSAVTVYAQSRGGRGRTVSQLGPYDRSGGDAATGSRGEAFGDSAVSVEAVAVGGDGGASNSALESGSGGAALATADASGAGLARVSAIAAAHSGLTGLSHSGAYTEPESKGVAEAQANATGLGEVFSRAQAGGEQRMIATSGATRPVGDLSSVEVRREAEAITYGSRRFNTVESSFSETPSFDQALARARTGTEGQGLGLAYGLPDAAAGATWLENDPRIRSAIENGGELLGLSLVSGFQAIRDSSSRVSFVFDTAGLAGAESLYFGLLGVDATQLGFGVLHIQLEANGNTVFDASFTDLALATASLDDLIVSTSIEGGGAMGAVELSALVEIDYAPTFSYTDSARVAFALFSAPMVPEPSVLVLLACALSASLIARARGQTLPRSR